MKIITIVLRGRDQKTYPIDRVTRLSLDSGNKEISVTFEGGAEFYLDLVEEDLRREYDQIKSFMDDDRSELVLRARRRDELVLRPRRRDCRE